MIWHQMTLAQGNLLDCLFPYPMPHVKATSTISAIISSPTKPELQVLPPLFLVGGKKIPEKMQGLEHLGGKPRVTPAECKRHLTSPASFLHL